jgi:RimJ/RimL family protein N-acetyltransferase
MGQQIHLRPVTEDDLETLFQHQLDRDAGRMAAFPSRDREAFFAHWAKILGNASGILRAIVCDGQLAGYLTCYERDGKRHVGYWLGKEFWGRGIASAAFPAFLELVPMRPLHAYVAKHNVASVRVLQKCGFVIRSEAPFEFEGEQLVEYELVLAEV